MSPPPPAAGFPCYRDSDHGEHEWVDIDLRRYICPGLVSEVTARRRVAASRLGCSGCGYPLAAHCLIHLVPCCPGKCKS